MKEKKLGRAWAVDELSLARCAEEERFWVSVATFFLHERQRELIDKGVF